MVESVEVIVVGNVMCDDLGVDDVTLALLTEFIQSLIKEGKCGLMTGAFFFESCVKSENF